MDLNALVLAIRLSLDLSEVVARPNARTVATVKPERCGIHLVALRFEGLPGQKFRLGSKTYLIGRRGYEELRPGRETTYQFEGEELPLVTRPDLYLPIVIVRLPKPGGSRPGLRTGGVSRKAGEGTRGSDGDDHRESLLPLAGEGAPERSEGAEEGRP
jgi:hypothetical protein